MLSKKKNGFDYYCEYLFDYFINTQIRSTMCSTILNVFVHALIQNAEVVCVCVYISNNVCVCVYIYLYLILFLVQLFLYVLHTWYVFFSQ